MNTDQRLSQKSPSVIGSSSDCDHCWAPGDAVQVTVDTPLGPIQGPFQYVRRCILCGKEIG